MQFNELVIVNDIILFKFSIHFIYITQSLDVEIFQFYKQTHDNVIKRVVRNDNDKFNRLKFLAILQNFRVFVFVKRTFRNAFKKCEIVSFELEIILDSLKAKINETRTKKFVISFSLFNECLQRTSRESQSHKRNIQILRVYYVKHENFNVNSRQMLRFLKNNEFQFHTLQLHTRDLNNVFEIIVKRDSRVNISI